jgi:hypothetical protein
LILRHLTDDEKNVEEGRDGRGGGDRGGDGHGVMDLYATSSRRCAKQWQRLLSSLFMIDNFRFDMWH